MIKKNFYREEFFMTKTRILLGLTVLLIMVTMVLAGCGGSPTKTTTAPTSNAATAPATSTTTAQMTSSTATTTKPATTTSAPATSGSSSGQNIAEILKLSAGISSVKYDMVTSAPGQPAATTKMFMKQKKMRMEMSAQGQNVVTFADLDKQTVYMYMPDQKSAIKMSLSNVPKAVTEEATNITSKSPVISGTETIDGKTCLVITYSDAGATVKSWIWKDKGLPVRSEVTAKDGTIVTEFKNFDFSTLDDSLFELPADAKIMDMGGMIPGGMPTNFPK
jgi:hypothetical protein